MTIKTQQIHYLFHGLGSDDASGIAEYEYALGTTSINDVVDWTHAGLAGDLRLLDNLMSDGQYVFSKCSGNRCAGNVTIVSGDGILIDLTPPFTGCGLRWVRTTAALAMKYLPVQILTLFGSWESFGDDASGIAGYEVSVNNGDVYPWTAVGDVETKKLDGLDLTHGSTYSFDVRAIDLMQEIHQRWSVQTGLRWILKHPLQM